MKTLLSIIFLVSLFLVDQTAWAQPYGYGTSTNSYNNSGYTANNSASSSGLSGWIQSVGNMFGYGNQSSGNFGSPFGPLTNMFQSGLFNGGNYYIYPPTGNPPDKLMANNDGSYYLYPADGRQPQKIVPNNDGSYSMYPPGYNPPTNSTNNNAASSNSATSNAFLPETIVPNNNGGYSIYPPGVNPYASQTASSNSSYNPMQPGTITANNDGTYNWNSPFGGLPERIVPMNSSQTTTQTQSQWTVPTTIYSP